MISYATVGAVDMDISLAFYDAVLRPLGANRFHSGDGFAGYKSEEGEQMLWVCTPFNKEQARCGNGIMIGLTAPSRAAVDEFHKAALANGGSCEGPPGLREAYGPDMYLAYVRDPVGNKLSALCSKPE
jgi:catechol 2,3-dioxygenase-like lactoylglutathione lyase family enzyme